MGSQVKEKNEVKTGVSLADAKQLLEKNDLTDIATQAGVSRAQVSNVLYGRSKNFKVAAMIIERAERNYLLVRRAEALKYNIRP
jgi:predicted XRE-type DNA-binding protein